MKKGKGPTAKDKATDKKRGIKEGGAKDRKIDKRVAKVGKRGGY